MGLRALLALALVLGLAGARDGRAAQPAGAVQSPGDNIGWDGRFGELGARSSQGRVDHLAVGPDGAIYAAGSFLWIGDAPATAPLSPTSSTVARWDGAAWEVIGATDGRIGALHADSAGVFIAGVFTHVNGMPARQVARWDGAAWSAVGGGLDPALYGLGQFSSVTRWNNRLYAAGVFIRGSQTSWNIYQWDGASWTGMMAGQAASDFVDALAAGPDGLYVGGRFAAMNGVPAANIARWDGAAWRAVGGGAAMEVRALAVVGQDLYAAGAATAPGGALLRWSGGSWSSLGAGAPQTLERVAVNGADIYAVDKTDSQGGVVWRRSGAAWAPDAAADNGIHDLAAAGGQVLLGGTFGRIGGVEAFNLARRTVSGWSAWGGAGDFGQIRAFAAAPATLYAGGFFYRVGSVRASNIAAWDGVGWAPLGAGVNGQVAALALKGSLLYAGGVFSQAGGASASGIAAWNGASWAPLGQGVSNANGSVGVQALLVVGDSLYVGGRFSHAGGVPARNLARWDGQSWSAVGGGVSGDVMDLAWDGANLYVGGAFTQAGSQPINNLARWDGQAWSGLDSGLREPEGVYALAWDRGQLYAGGTFLGIGGVFGARVARWDGQRWHAMGVGATGQTEAGYSPYVTELAAWNGAIYAGGPFDKLFNGDADTPGSVTSVPARGVARWDGQRWQAIGAGVNSSANAIAPFGGSLYLGGGMSVAGGRPSLGIARWSPPLRTYLPMARRFSR